MTTIEAQKVVIYEQSRELDILRKTLEVIALGESASPVHDAQLALEEAGFWTQTEEHNESR